MSRRVKAAAIPAENKAEDEANSKITVFKELLYDAMQANGTEDRLYTQEDLMALNALPDGDITTLLQVVQELVNDRLLNSAMRAGDGAPVWKWRDAREAEKYKQCTTQDQLMVYQQIDDAGSDGVWSQTAQRRLGMHENVFKTAIKQLISKGLIAPFKSIENPNKKMYIKASIKPSDKTTGGPWYTDQYLDEAFIEDLERVIYDFVKARSTYKSRSGTAATNGRTLQPKNGTIKGEVKPVRKRPADEISTGDETPAPPKPLVSPAPARKDILLPLPAGFTGYPTTLEVAKFLVQNGITNSVTLSADDVQKLMDVLEFDGLIECIKVGSRIGYRTVRPSVQSLDAWAVPQEPSKPEKGTPQTYGTPFNEIPCGRCPVFDLCEEGGPVSPSNCEYFKKWLGQE